MVKLIASLIEIWFLAPGEFEYDGEKIKLIESELNFLEQIIICV